MKCANRGFHALTTHLFRKHALICIPTILNLLLLFTITFVTACASGTGIPILQQPTPTPVPTVSVQVDRILQLGTSQFSTGMSLVDNSLDENNDHQAAINNVKSLIKQSITYENTYLMAWGAPDPWPNPNTKEPNNWGYLDSRMRLIQETGGTPVLSLSEAPWWMKGILQSDGSTHMLQASEEWSDAAYGSRVLDNKMNAWLHLVQRSAERYMASPYNVRSFQVWNELKGYYNPITHAYDYNNSPGNPDGNNAQHGYTYMYNQVYNRLMQVADELHIPRTEIQVGGPYVSINSFGNPNNSSNSVLRTTYANYDMKTLNVITYWLQHKVGGQFIALDGANINDDNINPADPFVAAEKFADVTKWVRSLDNKQYPGATTLPIWWSEWYAAPYGNDARDDYNNAIKAYAIINLIEAGGNVALSWGGGTGLQQSDTGLWTDPTGPNGGQPRPWYDSYRAFKEYFSPGTSLHKTIPSKAKIVAALASDTHIMLVNLTAKPQAAAVGDKVFSLAPYQVRTELF
jgi:hypothetical protein